MSVDTSYLPKHANYHPNDSGEVRVGTFHRNERPLDSRGAPVQLNQGCT